MTQEDLKELLERPELNKSAIAAKMFPNNKNARTALNSKLNEKQYGNDSTRRLTPEDLTKAWDVLKDLADDIYSKESSED